MRNIIGSITHNLFLEVTATSGSVVNETKSQKYGSTIRQARYTIRCKRAHKSSYTPISCYLHSVELSITGVPNLVHARGAHYAARLKLVMNARGSRIYIVIAPRSLCQRAIKAFMISIPIEYHGALFSFSLIIVITLGESV